MANKPAVRQSNFELLRIIAMLMIIGHHLASYNGYATAGTLDTANGMWMQFLRIGGKIGVSIFVMISGYFLVNSSRFKISKLLKLWLQVLFYSILCYLTASAAQGSFDLSFKTVMGTLLPITYDRWWFANTYLTLFVLSPFLNKMLHALSREAHLAMLIIMLIPWYAAPTFLLQSVRLTELIWFLFLYCLAGYIRLHGMRLFRHGYAYWIAAAAAVLLNFGLRVLFMRLGLQNQTFADYASDFSDLNKLPVLIVSLLIFLAFLNTEMKPRRWINTIASAAFGVYLIHEDPFIRQWLTDHVYRQVQLNSAALIPYTIAAVLGIYAVGGAFELLRINLIERWYIHGLQKADGALDTRLRRWTARLAGCVSDKNK